MLCLAVRQDWTLIQSPMLPTRTEHTIIPYEGNLLIIGGYSGPSGYTCVVLCYAPGTLYNSL